MEKEGEGKKDLEARKKTKKTSDGKKEKIRIKSHEQMQMRGFDWDDVWR